MNENEEQFEIDSQNRCDIESIKQLKQLHARLLEQQQDLQEYSVTESDPYIGHATKHQLKIVIECLHLLQTKVEWNINDREQDYFERNGCWPDDETTITTHPVSIGLKD